MRRAFCYALDLLIVAAGAVILFLLIGGGGVYRMAGTVVRLRSVGNPLIVLGLLLAARYICRRAAPFLGVGNWALDDADRRTLRSLLGAHVSASRLPVPRGWRWTTIVAIVALSLKLTFAWMHPGFHQGDDVEIQEMTIGTLTHAQWPIWNIRSALFPMGVIYPLQRLARAAGVTSIDTTVFVGRASVALLSTASILLVWRAGRLLFPTEAGYALLAVLLFASNKLHISFGSSELPRPVVAVLLIAAFVVLLRHRTIAGAWAGGALLGLAASLRYGEAGFVVAACLQLALERRWTHLVACALSSVLAAGAALGVADALYWGRPFASLLNIVDYTIVKRASSAGPPPAAWWYVTSVSDWATWPVIGLAIIGTRRATWQTALWTWLPIAILSALPPKEPRYMIPVMPFAALLAANGVRSILARWAVSPPVWHAAPVALAAALTLGFLHDAGGWRLRRSNDDVRFAPTLAAQATGGEGLAVEQLWRVGGHLYLGDVDPLIDLDPSVIRNAGLPADVIARARSIALDAQTASQPGVSDRLASAGYRAVMKTTSYVVFQR